MQQHMSLLQPEPAATAIDADLASDGDAITQPMPAQASSHAATAGEHLVELSLLEIRRIAETFDDSQ